MRNMHACKYFCLEYYVVVGLDVKSSGSEMRCNLDLAISDSLINLSRSVIRNKS